MSRLLVVEDDPDISLALKLLFTRAGYEVRHARRRPIRAAGGVRRASRPGRPRRRPARDGRLAGARAAARHQRRAGARADRARPGDGQGPRPARRRRRLPHQAVRQRRTAGPGRGAAAPFDQRRLVGQPGVRRRRAAPGPDQPAGLRQRGGGPAHSDRVPAAQHAGPARRRGAQPEPVAHPGVGRPDRNRAGAGQVRRTAAYAASSAGRTRTPHRWSRYAGSATATAGPPWRRERAASRSPPGRRRRVVRPTRPRRAPGPPPARWTGPGRHLAGRRSAGPDPGGGTARTAAGPRTAAPPARCC